MRDRKPFGSLLWAVLFVFAATFGFNGCGNVNDVVHTSTDKDAPIANAGPDLGSIPPGTLVTLNGSASTDPNGKPLTYSWTLLNKPAGSAAILANPTSVTPTFTVDLAGNYTAQLIVNNGTVNSAPNSVIISTANVAPVANAGPDQGGKAPGSLITLNGSLSSDANGDPLTFSWSLIAKPTGSTAVLANPTSVTPSFTVDRAGDYTAQLIVNDGTLDSTLPDTVLITTSNVAPVADAGPDQSGMALGALVTLNGSGSTDANGDPLTYLWSLTTKPVGSVAVLSSLTSVTPTFTVDLAGNYVVQLIVNDGTVNSAPNTVHISTVNVAPVANAGPDQGGKALGALVTLNGSASTDANGDPLTYSWSLTTKPAGSTAVLANPTSVTPTFTVDRHGDYTAQLIVNDGTVSSAPNTVNISTVNVAPVANAGPDQGGKAVGALVTLNGSASTDANGDPLTFSWSLTSKPPGSTAVLTNPTSVTPTFTVDRAGDYAAQLIVNDGTLNSAPNTVNISTVNVAPVANAGPDQGGKAPGALVTLNGSASSDANGDPLTFSWSLSPPPGSTAVLTNPTSVTPTFTVDRAGTYTAQLIVNDGTLSSAPNTVNISTVNVAPVANAGPDQSGMALGALVTLNGSASTDANGDPLTYSWSLTAKPAGSAAVLSSLTSVTPTFTVDRGGNYVVQLIVNDGTVSSAPNTVNISTVNVAPVANAGPDQGGKAPGALVTLNGSASSDANGDPLTYSWSLSPPPGSTAVLTNPTSVTPTFTVDRAGTYTAQLIVNDGTLSSAPNTVLITTNNVAPVANAGPDQGGKALGALVTLNGSASSDANGDPLTYSWSLSPPPGSTAVLTNPTSVTPTFTVDRGGTYTAQLIVNDGTLNSAPNTVNISTVNVAPVANAGPDQGGKAPGALVTLNGSASSDANGDPLTFSWSLSPPPGSTAVLTNPTSVTPTFTVDRAGTYTAQLIVNDGTLSSAPNTVNISTVNVAPVANAGPDQSGMAPGALIILDGSLSSDANGDPLTYSWSLTSTPVGSAAVLSSLTSVSTTFTADLAGSYVVQLIVNDGTVDSAPITVTITSN